MCEKVDVGLFRNNCSLHRSEKFRVSFYSKATKGKRKERFINMFESISACLFNPAVISISLLRRRGFNRVSKFVDR